MRWVLALTVALVLAAPARAEEPAPESLAFVEVLTEPERVYVHQPLELTLRVGFDREHFASKGVRLFRQEMDVPLQVSAPWLRTLEGLTAVEQAEGPTFALAGEVIRGRPAGDVTREGRTFTVLEVVRRCVPTEPGTLRLEGTEVRFAYATRFEEDFLGERVGLDARTVRVPAPPGEVVVRDLPEEGRPEGFGGAVGRFSVRASLDRPSVAVGEVLRLTLVIEGQGNLAAFETPRLDDVEGWHVQGALDDRAVPRRTIVYEIAATSADVRAAPTPSLAFFDPVEEAYRVVRSDPLPLTVRGGEADTSQPGEDAGRDGDQPSRWWIWVVALLLAVWIGRALGARARRAAADAEEPQPEAPDRGPQVRRALAALREAVAGEGDVGAALADVAAAWLGCSRAAVIAPGVAARLEAAGLDGDLAGDLDRHLEALTAARYGGDPAEPLTEAWVQALERAADSS